MSVSETSFDSFSNSFSISAVLSHETWTDQFAHKILLAASYLTDPLCKTHEYFQRIFVVDIVHPSENFVYRIATKVTLFVALAGALFVATFTTIPGTSLRYLGSLLLKGPFIHVDAGSEAKVLDARRSFTLLSWNICCTVAGYPITHGGVSPWGDRINGIVTKIAETDADVNCLYETFDSKSAFILCEKLKENGYNHFYYNIGPKVLGVSSGIFVASKFKVENPEFTPFPKHTLLGWTPWSSKGVFAFDLKSKGELFARVHATHLQDSAEPKSPTRDEMEARRVQMDLIVNKVNSIKDRICLVTGDLNLDDEEYQGSTWAPLFDKGEPFGQNEKTWGGDHFCSQLVGRVSSRPLNLDHTMMAKRSISSIKTTLINPGFDPRVFQSGALSDHQGLFSTIKID